jgi:N-acetylglutamate synthase-like GNAT family acetyltransferase
MKQEKILPMVLNDLDEILILSEQLGYPGNISDFESRFKQLQTLPHHSLFVYRNENKILAWMHLEVVSDLIEKTMVEIKSLVVDQRVRGQGIGQEMIAYAKKWTKTNGLDAIYLSCNIIRNKSHAFYQREGFVLNKTSHFFVNHF